MKIEIGDPMEYRVALYIRLSKENENEDPSESIANQKPFLRVVVKEYRLLVYRTHLDDGWSATSFKRLDFQGMIADIEAKRVNMVVPRT